MPTEEEINDQLKLLATHRQTLVILLEQQARHTGAYSPAATEHGIREARKKIQRVKQILRNWNVNVVDHPDDEDTSAYLPTAIISSTDRKGNSGAVSISNIQEIATSPLPAFSNEFLLQQAIAKLLTFMPSIADVRIIQRGSEFGKDIVFSGNGPLGDRVSCVCIIKNEMISGEVGTISSARNILQQVIQTLDIPYTDHTGATIHVQRVYIVCPYEITKESINSIEGALQKTSRQVTFIDGTELFRLFRTYWPNFFVDEFNAIEAYAEGIKQSIIEENAIEAVAAIYRIGSVSESEKQIYVPLGFSITVCAYKMADGLIDLLSSEKELNEPWQREAINRVCRDLRKLSDYINHFAAWKFWDDQLRDTDPQRIQVAVRNIGELGTWSQCLEEYGEALSNSWDIAARHKIGRKDTDAVPKFAADVKLQLANIEELVSKRRRAEIRIDIGAYHLRADLLKLENLVNSTRKYAAKHLTEPDTMRSRSLQDCIDSFPVRFFSLEKEQTIQLPRDFLSTLSSPVLIVASPGSGKSTFCRQSALRDAEALATQRSNIIPIYIPLYRLAYKKDWTLEEHLSSRIGKSALIPENTVSRWESGEVVLRFYLDGLDEIAKQETREFIIKQAKDLWENKTHIQIIVTSRDYVRFPGLSWLQRVSLAGLDEDGMESLIEQWLSSAPGLVHEFQRQLQASQSLRSLMTTPLLATLILLVFKHTQRLPASRTRLYTIFLELLCGGWDQAKNLSRDQRFGSDVKLMVLIELAGINHMKGIREFGTKELSLAVRRILRGIENTKLDRFLSEIVEDGIITGGSGRFEFAHFSFQEYLAARFLAGDPNTTHARRALKEFAFDGDDWWREPLEFYAGLMEPSSFTEWIVKELSRMGVSINNSQEIYEMIAEAHPSFNLSAYVRTEFYNQN